MLYMVTFTINIPQMLAYIPYMDPMGMDFHWFSPVLSLHLSHYLLFPYFFHDFPIEKTPFSIIFPFTLRTSTRGLETKTKGETHGKWMICSHGGLTNVWQSVETGKGWASRSAPVDSWNYSEGGKPKQQHGNKHQDTVDDMIIWYYDNRIIW